MISTRVKRHLPSAFRNYLTSSEVQKMVIGFILTYSQALPPQMVKALHRYVRFLPEDL